jgi:hypothetical protein
MIAFLGHHPHLTVDYAGSERIKGMLSSTHGVHDKRYEHCVYRPSELPMRLQILEDV